MFILGIETATSICSAAIADDRHALAEIGFDIKNIHDRVLTDGIAQLNRLTGVAIRQIGAIAVSAGPGSFTGLRIGMGVAKGLAFAEQKPLIAVSTLLAQATIANEVTRCQAAATLVPGEGVKSRLIVPVLKARTGQLYAAKYRAEEPVPARVVAEQALAVDSFCGWLQEPATICGNGLAMLRESGFLDQLPPCHLVEGTVARLSGGLIATLGYHMLARGEHADLDSLEPAYVQAFETGARLQS